MLYVHSSIRNLAYEVLPWLYLSQSKDLAVLYKNRAAVRLKQEEFELAIEDCTKSLDEVPNDPKAFYRRCQAYDSLGQFENAYKDAREVNRYCVMIIEDWTLP